MQVVLDAGFPSLLRGEAGDSVGLRYISDMKAGRWRALLILTGVLVALRVAGTAVQAHRRPP